jgi:low temperature requirement protein LtrA
MSAMTETTSPRSSRLGATLRREERVTALELFFDLVFVLAITQCTALMAASPTWEGLARGLLVLAVLWWAWVGYAWLTSVVDPEEGGVRIVLFGVMAALLVVSLCVPRAFGPEAALFVAAYGIVRAGQIALFWIADREDPNLRRSIAGLGVSSATGVGLLAVAALTDGAAQGALWIAAIALDFGGPFVFGSKGWRLAPRHFAERHALIVIIALGESIVAIGVGAGSVVDSGIVAAAVVGVAATAALWWLYFDVTAIAAERNLAAAPRGKVQNEIARDGYSYIHFLLVAGVVLAALGLKKTLGDVGKELETVPATALFGGSALFLLGLVAFRLRNVRTLSRQRLACALVLLALIPVATNVPSLAAVTIVAAVLAALIAYEAIRFADTRHAIRRHHHQHAETGS